MSVMMVSTAKCYTIDSANNNMYINFIGDSEEDHETVIRTFDDMMSGWFKFVQTEDGSVPAVFHNNGDDSGIINFKKAISAAFQANFKGTSRKIETDPQSLHVAEYTYVVSLP